MKKVMVKEALVSQKQKRRKGKRCAKMMVMIRHTSVEVDKGRERLYHHHYHQDSHRNKVVVKINSKLTARAFTLKLEAAPHWRISFS